MEPKKSISSQIDVIEKALSEAKNIRTTASYYYKLWGALLFVHFLLKFIVLKEYTSYSILLNNISILIFPFGGFLSYKKKLFDKKIETAQSLFERVYFFGFISFSLAYAILIVFSIWHKSTLYLKIYPMIIGMVVFYIGGVTKHKPSIFLGLIGCLFSVLSLNSNATELLLIAAIVSAISILLPGILMRDGKF